MKGHLYRRWHIQKVTYTEGDLYNLEWSCKRGVRWVRIHWGPPLVAPKLQMQEQILRVNSWTSTGVLYDVIAIYGWLLRANLIATLFPIGKLLSYFPSLAGSFSAYYVHMFDHEKTSEIVLWNKKQYVWQYFLDSSNINENGNGLIKKEWKETNDRLTLFFAAKETRT